VVVAVEGEAVSTEATPAEEIAPVVAEEPVAAPVVAETEPEVVAEEIAAAA